RNGEAMGSLNTKGRVAAMYSYSKTKGLFGGVSIEGSIIVERQDANAIAYQADVTAKQLLSGVIPPPHWADGLIQLLTQTGGDPMPGWIDDDPMSPNSERPSMGRNTSDYSFQGIGSTPSRSAESVFARGHKKAMSLNPFNKKPSNDGLSSISRDPGESDGYFGRSSLGSSSRTRDWSPPRSKLEPPKPTGPAFDGFADDEDDISRKNPSSAPQATSTSTSWYPKTQVPPVSSTTTSWYPNSRPGPPKTTPSATSGSIFPTYFESDYVPDAPSPVSSASRPFAPTLSPNPPIYQPSPSRGSATGGFSFGVDSKSSQNMDSLSLVAPIQPSPVGNKWSSNDPFDNPPVSTFDEKTPDGPIARSQSSTSNKPVRTLSVKRGLNAPAPPGTVKVVALFDYAATEAGDLSFREGDVIYVTEKTGSTNDWWTGRLAAQPDKMGIFPANFVELAA
ncbi:hypothetical protein FRB90_001917, partial [Tulasnella sp. 427]